MLSENVPKTFCDNLLKMFSDNTAGMLCPTVLENVLENALSGMFCLSSQNVRG